MKFQREILHIHWSQHIIVVTYELYELYDWGKVPELYGTLRILRFAGLVSRSDRSDISLP